MDQKLVLHPAIHTPQKGDVIFELTDIQLHTNKRPNESIDKIVERSVELKQPGRVVFLSHSQLRVMEDNAIVFATKIFNDNQLLPLIQKYHQQGKRVFLKKPEVLPVYPGKDAVEFIKSKKGQRILRRLEKTKA